jgi:uncharacterized protein with NRDE domain
MCTVVILRRPGNPWPFLMAANRDEMAGRPWRPPGHHWPDRPKVTAGLDIEAGGSWLGINRDRVVAGILNRPQTLGPKEGYRSRGELPLEALDHATASDAARALSYLDPAAYRPFNLVVADPVDAFWLRSEGHASKIAVVELPAGLSMITAHDRNDNTAERIRFNLPRFEQAEAPDPEAGDWQVWATLMASREFEPGAGPRGAMTVVTDQEFGTVSSSLIALPDIQRFETKPIFLFAAGRPGDTPYDTIEL